MMAALRCHFFSGEPTKLCQTNEATVKRTATDAIVVIIIVYDWTTTVNMRLSPSDLNSSASTLQSEASETRATSPGEGAAASRGDKTEERSHAGKWNTGLAKWKKRIGSTSFCGPPRKNVTI